METVFVPLELAAEASSQVDVRLPPEKTSSGVGRSACALDVAWLGSLLIDHYTPAAELARQIQ